MKKIIFKVAVKNMIKNGERIYDKSMLRKKSFLCALLSVMIITIFSGCSFFSDRLTSKPVSNQPTDGHLYPACKMVDNVKKWGYINSQSKFMIQPKFQSAESFGENSTARVTYNNLIGVIDKTGRILIKPSYQYVNDFSEGIAIAVSASTNEAINLKGKVIYSSKDSIGRFNSGRAVINKRSGASGELYGYIDKEGTEKIAPQYKNANEFYNNKALVQAQDGKYELIDTEGKVLINFPYIDMSSCPKSDYYTFTDNNTHKKGYIDASGKIIIEPKYDNTISFNDGFAIVGVSDKDNNLKYGLINEKGEYVIKPEYPLMEYLSEGLYSVTKDSSFSYGSKKAIINTKGSLLSDFIYYEVNKVNNSSKKLLYASDDKNTYFIDNSGKKVSSFQGFKGKGTLSYDGRLISADIDNRLSYVTKEGKIIWKEDNIYSFPKNIKVKEVKYNPDRFTLIYYPEVSGLADSSVQSSINETLKKKFIGENNSNMDSGNTNNLECSFSANLINNLLIIHEEAYDYPFGAAHGMPYKHFYHIDINSGTIYKLSDLFKPGSNYVQKLNTILKVKIADKNKTANSIIFRDDFKGMGNEENFYLTKDALNIFFDPYEIAPFSAGFPTFSISYGEIKDIIDTNGKLWKAMGDNKIPSLSEAPAKSDAEVKASMDKYENGLMDAVNKNDFSCVEHVLYENSNLYKAQKQLIDSLNKQGIKEKLNSYSVDSVEWNAYENVCKVYVKEDIAIKYPGKDYASKKFAYIYSLKYSDKDKAWQLSDIEKWN